MIFNGIEINEGDFVEYYVLKGRGRGRLKSRFGTVTQHNGKLMIKLIFHKDMYAKFYAGIRSIRVMSELERDMFLHDMKLRYLKGKIKYIKYITGRKEIPFLKKIWFIRTYGLKLRGGLWEH